MKLFVASLWTRCNRTKCSCPESVCERLSGALVSFIFATTRYVFNSVETWIRYKVREDINVGLVKYCFGKFFSYQILLYVINVAYAAFIRSVSKKKTYNDYPLLRPMLCSPPQEYGMSSRDQKSSTFNGFGISHARKVASPRVGTK